MLIHLVIAFSLSSISQTMAAQKIISLIILVIFHTNALKCIVFPHPAISVPIAKNFNGYQEIARERVTVEMLVVGWHAVLMVERSSRERERE